jgi:hypothetical protein
VKRERLSTAETLGWSVVGFGAGLFGGLWAAARLGRITSGRLADEMRAAQTPGRTSAVALAESVRTALLGDPALATHDWRPLAVSRGVVELAGWVPDRRTRTRAIRVARGVPGLEDLIDSILVRGEDDFNAPPELVVDGRSA